MRLAPFASLALLLAACAGHRGSWLARTSGPLKDASGERAFYGRAFVAGVRNQDLAWNIAEERARAEVHETLGPFMDRLLKDYGRTNEIDLTGAMRTLTSLEVDSSTIVARQELPDGRRYALCRLPLSVVKAGLETSPAVGQGLRAYLSANAERVFDALPGPRRARVEDEAPGVVSTTTARGDERLDLASLKDDPRSQGLYHLDAGLLAQYEGRWDESERELSAALPLLRDGLAEQGSDYADERFERDAAALALAVAQAQQGRPRKLEALLKLPAVPAGRGEAVLIHYDGPAPRKVTDAWTVDGLRVPYPKYVVDGAGSGASTLRAGAAAAASATALDLAAQAPKQLAARVAKLKPALVKAAQQAEDEAREHDRAAAVKYGENSWQRKLSRATTPELGGRTEADTRCSLALPARVRVARLALAPGARDLYAAGKRFPAVSVQAGRRVFLVVRTP